MTGPRGVFIEIVERRKRPEQDSLSADIIVPNEVRLNGQVIAIPKDEPITVHEMSGEDVVKVTLTVFARRIFVGTEDISDDTVDAVHAAHQALTDAHDKGRRALAEYNLALEQAQRNLADVHRQLAEETA